MAAANTTLKINVDTSDATRSLTALEGKFETLKTAILGVGFATAIAQANSYANAIKDVSVASDLSIASVSSLSKAFSVNGGSAEGAQNAILKFADSVGNAIAGSDALQKSFAKAGISLADLQNLTQQQLFDKYIAGLKVMGSTAERTKNQLDILGKASKGVDFGGGVQGTLANAPASARDTAAILAGCATRPIAASACATYTGGGYNDWYLPSYDELNVLYNNRVALSIGNNFYWNSSQVDANSAYYQYFGNGSRSNTFKDNDFGGGQIRAIRDFVSKN
jgi:hypothetical protein